MGANWRACLMHILLCHCLTLILICLDPSLILRKHSMTLNFGIDAPPHYYCRKFNCSENIRNMIWWKVFEVCCMNCIVAYDTTYGSVPHFSVERPHILSYIPESCVFVYVFLFNINIEHKHEISFIYKHQYVTLLHHVSVHW
jgi:hypothetical protein